MADDVARLEISDGPGERTLVLAGDVDSHTAPQLEARLDELGDRGDGGDVTLDLVAVDFIDSSGLRVIVAAHSRLTEAGHRLLIVSPSKAVTRLLEITGLAEHLDVR